MANEIFKVGAFEVESDGSVTAAVNGTLGATTPASAAVTTLTASSTAAITGVTTLGDDLVLDDTPSIGGSLTLKSVDSGIVSVNTGGAATTITLAIPDKCSIAAFAGQVTTEIAGIDSTTGTFALTGGNTETIGTISAFTAGTALTGIGLGGADLTTSATTNASFTLSGGADNTPSAGAVRLKVWYFQMEALD